MALTSKNEEFLYGRFDLLKCSKPYKETKKDEVHARAIKVFDNIEESRRLENDLKEVIE